MGQKMVRMRIVEKVKIVVTEVVEKMKMVVVPRMSTLVKK